MTSVHPLGDIAGWLGVSEVGIAGYSLHFLPVDIPANVEGYNIYSFRDVPCPGKFNSRVINSDKEALDPCVSLSDFRSYGSRDARSRAQPRVEGTYALRQRLSAGNEVRGPVRLPQAAGSRDAGLYARLQR